MNALTATEEISEARQRFIEAIAFGSDVDISDAESDLIDACDKLKRWAAREAANRIAALDRSLEPQDPHDYWCNDTGIA